MAFTLVISNEKYYLFGLEVINMFTLWCIFLGLWLASTAYWIVGLIIACKTWNILHMFIGVIAMNVCSLVMLLISFNLS